MATIPPPLSIGPIGPDSERNLREATELLQALIRNACVNDGTLESGNEARSAEVLAAYLNGSGLDFERFEAAPRRTSLVARIEGSDPSAPTLCLMGHTDVVPAPLQGWTHDPFGAELIDGEIWGRGALDMLYLTASMAVGVRRLSEAGWRPRGTLVYLAVADEEAGGSHGARWLLDHERDAVFADYVLSESGGWSIEHDSGPRVVITAAEKGGAARRLKVRGTPGHGSMPYGADNAIIKAADVLRRIAEYRPEATITDAWRSYVEGLGLAADVATSLVDPDRVNDAIDGLANRRFAAYADACTHTTFSPNVMHGGTKTNVIPDEVVIDLDVRVLPGDDPDGVDEALTEALGPLAEAVTVERLRGRPGSESRLDTPLFDALVKTVRRVYPTGSVLPRLASGGTDSSHFRNLGSVAYGFGLLSPAVRAEDYTSRFHGRDERIDLESLRLTTDAWGPLCRDVLD